MTEPSAHVPDDLVLVLLPRAARPIGDPIAEMESATHGKLVLYSAPDPRLERLMFYIGAPMSLRFDGADYYAQTNVETRSLHREPWCNVIRRLPRDRRREAREGTRGRRGAKAVPMAERREIDLFAEPDVPERTRHLAASAVVAPLTAVVWRCPWWRRGRPIWAAAIRARHRLT